MVAKLVLAGATVPNQTQLFQSSAGRAFVDSGLAVDSSGASSREDGRLKQSIGTPVYASLPSLPPGSGHQVAKVSKLSLRLWVAYITSSTLAQEVSRLSRRFFVY